MVCLKSGKANLGTSYIQVTSYIQLAQWTSVCVPNVVCIVSFSLVKYRLLIFMSNLFNVSSHLQSSRYLHYHRAPAVVKVTLQVNGRTEFSGSRPAKTTAGIKMKCDIIDYVGKGTPRAKVGSSQITGGVSPYGWHVPICQNAWFRGKCIPLGVRMMTS